MAHRHHPYARPTRAQPTRDAYDEPRRAASDEPRRAAYEEPRREVYEDFPSRSTFDEPRRTAYDYDDRYDAREPARAPAFREPAREPARYVEEIDLRYEAREPTRREPIRREPRREPPRDLPMSPRRDPPRSSPPNQRRDPPMREQRRDPPMSRRDPPMSQRRDVRSEMTECSACNMLGDEKMFSKNQLNRKNNKFSREKGKTQASIKCKSCITAAKMEHNQSILVDLATEVATAMISPNALQAMKKDDNYRWASVGKKLKSTIARLERDEEGNLKLTPLVEAEETSEAKKEASSD